MSMLRELVPVQLQISRGRNRSSGAALAKALDEPAVSVRFAPEQLRDHGIVFRRGDGDRRGGPAPRMRSANIKRVPRPPASATDQASLRSAVGILQKIRSNWQDVLYGGMILASLAGAIYMFSKS